MGTDQVELDTQQVVAELSERGRLEWELALAKATNKRLVALLNAAEAGKRETTDA